MCFQNNPTVDGEKYTSEDNTSSKYKLISLFYLELIQITEVREFTNEQMQSLNTQIRRHSHQNHNEMLYFLPLHEC